MTQRSNNTYNDTYYHDARGKVTGLSSAIVSDPGSRINSSDPFGLCPPQNNNVDDCKNDELGNAWRALKATGKVGMQIIDGVVAGHIGVTVTSDLSCSSDHSCENPETKAIEVNAADKSGTMAVAIGHEYQHTTEIGIARTCSERASREAAAWDFSEKVYDDLHNPYRRQAEQAFSTSFQDWIHGRQAAINNWTAQCEKEKR